MKLLKSWNDNWENISLSAQSLRPKARTDQADRRAACILANAPRERDDSN